MGPQASVLSADPNADAKAKREAENRACIDRAKDLHQRASDFMRDNFIAMAADLEMAAGGERQWEQTGLRARKRFRRPVVTDDRLAASIKQITGELYQSRPSIRVAPGDGAATADVADVFEGIIRNIESRSQAAIIYPLVVQSAADCGVGHARIKLRYADTGRFDSQEELDSAFDVEPIIELIGNQFSVLRDPECKEPQHGDAKETLVIAELDRKKFEAAYPQAGIGGWAKATTYASQHLGWKAGDKITVAEYWEVKREPTRIVRLRQDRPTQEPVVDEFTGRPVLDPMTLQPVLQTVPPTMAESVLRDPDEMLLDEARESGWSVVQERVAETRRICMHLLGGDAVLSGPHYWPGQRIPIFTCEGEVRFIGEERQVQGVIRRSADNQRTLNYIKSNEIEVLSQAPKAPWLVEDSMIVGYEDEWLLAASQPAPYLRYKRTQGGGRPERQDPISANTGLQAAAMAAVDGIKANTGFFDASLGQRSNETSGVAIEARDNQSQTGASVYGANLAAMLSAMGQELVNIIPALYSERKMVAILGEDDAPAIADLEQLRLAGRGLDIGRYMVTASQGPSFQTQRDKENDWLMKAMDALGRATSPLQVLTLLRFIKNSGMKNADDFVAELRASAEAMGMLPPSQPPQGQPGMPGMPPGAPGLPMPPEQMMPPEAMGFDPMQAAPDFPPGRAPASFERVAPNGRPGMQGAYN